jgi:hypothetical protein
MRTSANGTYSYHIVASYNSGDSAPGNTQEVTNRGALSASKSGSHATSDDIDLSLGMQYLPQEPAFWATRSIAMDCSWRRQLSPLTQIKT